MDNAGSYGVIIAVAILEKSILIFRDHLGVLVRTRTRSSSSEQRSCGNVFLALWEMRKCFKCSGELYIVNV